MKIKKDKKRKSKNLFYKIISVLLLISSLFFVGVLSYIDLLPVKYLIVIIVIIFLFNLFNIILLNLRRLKRKIKKVLSIIVILVIIIMTIGSFYICKTLGVLMGNGDSKYKLEHYSVIVLNTSEYDKLKDIKGETIGYFVNSIGAEDANDKLQEKVEVEFSDYKSSNTLMEDLLNSHINVIMIEDSVKTIMEEENAEFMNSIKVLYTFTIKVEVESTLKDVDVTKEPFAIYISGIDTYGEIASVSRSDVNMVMVVNPETRQILLISIPRDYYVQLHGTTGTKDKLTHAGIYGIDMSIQTIEDLLEIEINYYLKVNFTSVIDIVDALGGLEVYSEYSFISYSGYRFKEGLNSVNGEQALDFVRTRKAFSDGDRQRGKNQQALIEAIIRKATNKSILTKYNSLLSAINGKYQTNMSSKKITSLIKMQLNDMSSWNITSYSLTGIDSSNYTYTYYQLLYVMEPDEDSVNEAISMIDSVINGETLENSYEGIGGTSNKVTQVIPQETTSTPSKEEEKKETIEDETESVIEYTITFNSNGGTDVSNQIIEENGLVEMPINPTKDGYTFIGWYLDGEEYDFSTEVTEDIILEAKWEEEKDPIEDIVPEPEDTEIEVNDGDLSMNVTE